MKKEKKYTSNLFLSVILSKPSIQNQLFRTVFNTNLKNIHLRLSINSFHVIKNN